MSLALRDFATSSKRGLAVAAMALSVFGMAANEAKAADDSLFCLPTAQMKTHLNAKGQYSLVMFEHDGSDKSKFVLRAYYSTKDGSRATEVVGETRRDPDLAPGKLQIPAEMCIDSEYTNVKIAYNRSGTVPASFYEKNVSQADASKICAQRKWGDCGVFNTALDSGSKNGKPPMLQMTAAKFNPDGTIARLGVHNTITASPDGAREGAVLRSYDGVGTIKYDIAGAIYSKDGATALTEGWPIVVATSQSAQPGVALASLGGGPR